MFFRKITFYECKLTVALFPWLTVRGNVEYWPKVRGVRKRVVIARAFAVSPELLLMDEPYGQLDIELRNHVTRLIKWW